MATPTINAITVEPQTIAPGGQATITVDAVDPDSQEVTVSVTVTDAAGNTGTGSAKVRISDPLTYSASVPDGQGTVAQGSKPNEFIYTAP